MNQLSDQQLQAASEAIMAEGSKSFAFAARFLPAWQRRGARYLYAWCRHCDDLVDTAPSAEEKLRRVERLEEKTRLSWVDAPTGDPVFQAFREVSSAHRIPQDYALDLLEGMRADAEERRYETLPELERYCYYVAGTVGLMMCHVMGVSNPRALGHAVDLGVAMQLTNIARDVREDFEMGRIYLPLAWLREAGIPEGELLEERHREALCGIVTRLLAHAEGKYRSGADGLRYLHWRSALAIRVASGVYSGIGTEVLARGKAAWEKRCFTSPATKLRLAFKALLCSLPEIPARIMQPWAAKPIDTLWRPL